MDLLKDGIELGGIKKTGIKKKITIDGITEPYDVYRVKLDYLYYNDKNDRIATWISQYKIDNNVEQIDMSNIEEYNNIIQEFIYNSNREAIKKTETNIKLVDQREPGVILSDGRIIDGNRRVTCLRNLAKENPKFDYFETIILDKNLKNNEKQIKSLELMIQHGEDSKIDYNPIDRLVGIYNDLIENKLLTVKEYAYYTNSTEADVKKKIDLAKLLVEFLDTINAPKQFYIARDMDLNGPLVELYDILKKVDDEDKKADIKIAVFTNFLMQPKGDMTRFIRKIKTITKSNKKELDEYVEEQLEIAEKVLDKLPPIGKMNKKVISDEFRNNEKIKEELADSLEKAVTKVKAKEVRNKPLKILKNAKDTIETIDISIFKRLDQEQLSEIVEQACRIEELLQKIKGAVDV